MDEEVKTLSGLFSEIPTIDFNNLAHQTSQTRSTEVEKIRQACQQLGFFQITNHGISKRVIEDAIDASEKFFDLPVEEKSVFSCEDVTKPVRFVMFWSDDGDYLTREFIKLYAHPIQDCIQSWPHKPADYRERMGKYVTEVRQLFTSVMQAIMESLGLSETPKYLMESIEQGMQMIAVNHYPQCSSSSSSSSSSNSVGISSHTDHSIITILVETTRGLEILDIEKDSWKLVPIRENGFIVLVGNHLEVLSNGLYKSVVHRVVQSFENGRVSIGSFHSLPMEEIAEPILELVDRDNTKRYRATSLSDFIKYLSSKQEKPYIESLKI